MIADWDDAYSNGKYFAGADECARNWSRKASAYRSELFALGRFKADISYGHGNRQMFDLFMPSTRPKGLAVFVHGGYWLSFCKDDWSHLARGSVDRGWAVAIIGYDLCPNVRISAIAKQVEAGVLGASALVDGPIRLAGHSAGGHLATRVVCSDFAAIPRVQKVLSISGVHDLRPILRTSMNNELRIDLAEAQRESPALCAPHNQIAVTAWVGADERPEFIRQAKLLANVWTGCGAETKYVEEVGTNHFTLIDGLESAQSALMSEFLD